MSKTFNKKFLQRDYLEFIVKFFMFFYTLLLFTFFELLFLVFHCNLVFYHPFDTCFHHVIKQNKSFFKKVSKLSTILFCIFKKYRTYINYLLHFSRMQYKVIVSYKIVLKHSFYPFILFVELKGNFKKVLENYPFILCR